MKVLVTGAAGFIGFHVVHRLLERGDEVVGLDDLNDYYAVQLKRDRLACAGIVAEEMAYNQPVPSAKYPLYRFVRLKLEDTEGLAALFEAEGFDTVCHLAAQAGVRYSLVNPRAYVNSNILGFVNILENCRHHRIGHLTYASSSSVYGLNERLPFSTHDNVDHPVSLYAASKKSNELMAHSYSHLFGLPTTGLRFFTVYGPWGRPDMAPFLFAKAIRSGEPVQLFNGGDMMRDFTYVDDIVEGVVRVLDRPPAGDPNWSGLTPDPAGSKAPYKLYNIGNQHPVRLLDFLSELEKALGKTARIEPKPMQPGDLPATCADVSELTADFGYQPTTDLPTGVQRFVDWYLGYYC